MKSSEVLVLTSGRSRLAGRGHHMPVVCSAPGTGAALMKPPPWCPGTSAAKSGCCWHPGRRSLRLRCWSQTPASSAQTLQQWLSEDRPCGSVAGLKLSEKVKNSQNLCGTYELPDVFSDGRRCRRGWRRRARRLKNKERRRKPQRAEYYWANTTSSSVFHKDVYFTLAF